VRVKFWGVRGSIPAPKRGTRRYGGNTPCVEVRAGNQLLIFDAGTGIQDLGSELSARLGETGLRAYLFFTHYHWDHIQGLPFFAPIYFSGATLKILGPRPGEGGKIAGVIRELFTPPFFPVSFNQLRSSLRFEELPWESDFFVGEARIRTCQLNHPQHTLAYRIDHDGASVVYATDHEPGDPACDEAIRRLAAGADLLISDAQYRPDELGEEKAGWGHGSWKHSVAIAQEAGVKRLLLFHHDPYRTDTELDYFVSYAREGFAATWAAGENMELEVAEGELRVISYGSTLDRALDGFSEDHSFIRGETFPEVKVRGPAEPSGRVKGLETVLPRQTFEPSHRLPEEEPSLLPAIVETQKKGNGHASLSRGGGNPMLGVLFRWEMQTRGREQIRKDLLDLVHSIETEEFPS